MKGGAAAPPFVYSDASGIEVATGRRGLVEGEET